MSMLNRVLWRAALTLPIAASMAGATMHAARAAGPAAPPSMTQLLPVIPGLTQKDEPLTCLLSTFDLGPFGPLGPWGPLGPLHDKPHPACVGGGPEYR
jgi:hypothetical protein